MYQGAAPGIGLWLRNLLLRGNSLSDCKAILGLSIGFILNWLIKNTDDLHLQPQKKHYGKVQIDELWTYVGDKSNKKWVIYAYAPETDEVLAYVMGKRDKKTVKKLYKKLANRLVLY